MGRPRRTGRHRVDTRVRFAQVMPSISASTSIDVPAPVEQVIAAVADYRRLRPKILTDQYRDYRVVEGGEGEGTVVTWDFQANPRLAHPIRASVHVDRNVIREVDEDSALVITWAVAPSGAGATVTLTVSWNPDSVLGGVFDRALAPMGLKKLQATVLGNLRRLLLGDKNDRSDRSGGPDSAATDGDRAD